MSMSLKEIIEFYVVIIGLPLVFYQILILTKQLKLSIKQMQYQTDWDKKNATFKYIDKYTIELKDTNKIILDKINIMGQSKVNHSNNKYNSLLQNSTYRADIMRIVAYFELLGLGIKHEYLNNDIAKDALQNMVITNYNSLLPYIVIRRKEINSRIAKNFENLFLLWNNNL